MTPKIAGLTGFILFTTLTLLTLAYCSANARSGCETTIYYVAGPAVAMVYPYTVVMSLVLMVYRNRWLEGSLMRWAKHSALSFVLTALGLGVGLGAVAAFSELVMFEFEKDSIWFGLTTAIYVTMFATTPLLFFAGQLAMLRARATRSGEAL